MFGIGDACFNDPRCFVSSLHENSCDWPVAKVTTQDCAITYPAKLESFGDGTYVGDLPNWNGGRYSIIDGNRIKLDTLTGPGVYEIELSRDRLTFKKRFWMYISV